MQGINNSVGAPALPFSANLGLFVHFCVAWGRPAYVLRQGGPRNSGRVPVEKRFRGEINSCLCKSRLLSITSNIPALQRKRLLRLLCRQEKQEKKKLFFVVAATKKKNINMDRTLKLIDRDNPDPGIIILTCGS